MNWQLAEAKNKFSELMSMAINEGPQVVSRRSDSVVIINQSTYDELVGRKLDFKSFLLNNTNSLEGLDLSRDASLGRDVLL